MPFDFRIESLVFDRPDDPVQIKDADIVVLIGPNNCGKSQALRDIQANVRDGVDGLVVRDLAYMRGGSVNELEAWLRKSGPIRSEGGREFAVSSQGSAVAFDNLEFFWASAPALRELSQHLVLRADADTRLQLAANVASLNPLSGEAMLPLQRLLKDHAAEAALSEAVRHAFRDDICVNRAGGSELSLHLGKPTAEPRLDSPEYLIELQSLPLVAAQGDGMRSYIGLMLTLIATSYPVVLIDEPEAFLHPPQARELGYQLASRSRQQRFIATHSADVLVGLLDGPSSLIVVRLRRFGDTSIAAVLDHTRVQALWSDPSFRYSNLFDGLFHAGVVICEAEGDARLYAATLDDIRASRNEPTPDLLFTPCGGKHKLPTIIDALHPLGVPVSVIADIDVLRDSTLLRRVVETLGADWERFESDARLIATAVDQIPVQAPLVNDARNEIDEELGSDPTARVSEAQTRRIREITKTTDGWRLLKTSGGVSAVPSGQAAAAVARLLPALEAVGLFVVPVGTLEQWERSIGKHGLAFVDAALQTDVHKRNLALREFMTRLDVGMAAVPNSG
jgi:hypothetical protein